VQSAEAEPIVEEDLATTETLFEWLKPAIGTGMKPAIGTGMKPAIGTRSKIYMRAFV